MEIDLCRVFDALLPWCGLHCPTGTSTLSMDAGLSTPVWTLEQRMAGRGRPWSTRPIDPTSSTPGHHVWAFFNRDEDVFFACVTSDFEGRVCAWQ